MNTLDELGISLTDESGNIRDVIQVYTEVAEKIKTMSEIEKANVVFGLGGTYHRTRLQALLDDLGSADSMYRSMYETSVNSAGSANVENEKYMKSLEARINSMKIKVEELALAIGNAFLTDGMIAFMNTAMSVLGALTKVVDTVGALPVLFATITGVIMLFSRTANNMGSAIISSTFALTKQAIAKKQGAHASLQYSTAMNKAIVANGTFTKSANTATVATRTLTVSKRTANLASAQFGAQLNTYSRTTALANGATKALSVSIRMLGTAMLTALPFLAIGFVVEKLMEASAKARELKENAISANNELTESYKSNKDEINSLVAQYEELENVVNSGNYDLETLDKYYDVQNKIGQLMPRLVTGEDEYGNKLVESSTAVKDKISVLEQQLELEKELSLWQDRQNRDERIEGNDKLIKDNSNAFHERLVEVYSDVIDANIYKKLFNDIPEAVASPEFFQSLDDIQKYLEKIRDARNEAERSGNTKMVEHYSKLAQKVSDAASELSGFDASMKQAQSANRIDYISKLNDVIDNNGRLTNSAKEELKSFSSEMMRLSDISDSENLNDALNKIFMNVENNSDIKASINGVIEEFSKLEDATETEFDTIVSKIQQSIVDIEAILKSFGLSDSEIASVIDTLNEKLNVSKSEFAKIDTYAKENGVSFEEAKVALSEYADEVEDATTKFEEFADKLKETTDSIAHINGVLEDYNETGQLSAQTMIDLIGTYPSLIDYIGDEAGMIKELTRLRDEDIVNAKKQLAEKLETSEIFYENNIKLIEQFVNNQFKFYEGDLTHFENLAKAKASVETELINNLAKKWGVYYSQQLKSFSMLPEEATQSTNSFGIDIGLTEKAINAQKELNDFYKQWEDFTVGEIDLDFSKIGTSLDKTTSSAQKANSTTKESVYFTDKYKQSMDELTLAIEKQQKLQEKFPDYSADYRKSLESELKLQQQKLDLMNAQAKALDAQIKSGKIAQTGSVSDPKYSNSTTATSKNVKVSGWSGSLTSAQGNRVNPVTGKSEYHRGIDIAGAKGTRLDANRSGKVIASGSASSQGYHSSYGNIVVIKDDSGNKHLYAHLDKAVAKIGDYIQAGTKIGTIGSTGNSTGPHLHYEVSNAQGVLQSAANFAKEARSGTVHVAQQVSTASVAVDGTQQAIDKAKSDLLALKGDILAQEDVILGIEQGIIDSFFAYFDHKQDVLDKDMSLQNSRLALTNKNDSKYNKILDYQMVLLEKKKKYQQDEIEYINALISKGGLSEETLDNLRARLVELETGIRNINGEIQQFKLDRVVNEYDRLIESSNQLIGIENAKLELLNQKSSSYRATLEGINSKYEEQKDATEEVISSLRKLIKEENLVGEQLDEASDRINDLTTQLFELENQISDGNYNIVVNIQTNFNELDDDIQFEIDREKLYRDFYVEGSANYAKSMQREIDLTKEQAKNVYDLYDAYKKELEQLDFTAERYKEVTELMEDAEIRYWSLTASVKNMTKELEDSRKNKLEEIADDMINAYKDYLSERQDETNRAYEEELEREEERHNKIMQNYEDEMDAFRKNVEERLELIDRAESERNYNMEINDMEAERKTIDDQIRLLALDDSREAKKKRKDLQKQLDDIDKQIAEARHDREIELQKQNLNDILELKEEEISEKEEIETERYEALVESINAEKEYWNQHYTDLLNDQRKFNQMREDIINGHLDKVQAEFEGYAVQLESTMHKLENTLGGTMEAVGTAIRQNVIDELRRAISMVDEFNDSQNANSNLNTDSLVSSDRDPNANKPSLTDSPSTTPSNNNDDAQTRPMSNPDYKVLMAKYFRENLVKVNGVNQNTIDALKAKGDSLAKQGRSEGSIIMPDETLASALTTLSPEQRKEFKSYVQTNAPKYLTQDFLKNDILKWAASLDTGGYLNFGSSSGGVDGKGGKFIIGHDQEVILDKVDTKRLLSNIEVSDSMLSKIATMTQSFSNIVKGMTSNLSLNSGVGDIVVNFGDVHNATQSQARNFATDFINEVKTKKGGW